MLRGADASSLVDWTLGIGFGFARCQRQYGAKDPAFDANLRRMHALSLIGGGYEFALPTTYLPDPAERARASWRFFTEGEPPRPPDLYALDLETSPVGQDETNAWARAWYDEWHRVADRPPGIYLGSGYLTNRTGAGLRDHGFAWLWYPRPFTSTWDTSTWPDGYTPPPPKNRDGVTVAWADCAWGGLPDFWQFAFGNTYDGNVFNGTLTDLQSLNQEPDLLTAEERTWIQSTIADEIAKVWSKQFKEYVDENGNQVNDPRTTADILYATHRAAMRLVGRDAADQGDIDALLAAIKAQPSEFVAALKTAL